MSSFQGRKKLRIAGKGIEHNEPLRGIAYDMHEDFEEVVLVAIKT